MDISIDQLSQSCDCHWVVWWIRCDTCNRRPASKQRFLKIQRCQAPFICSGVQLEMLWINIFNVYYGVGVVIQFSAYPKVSSTFRSMHVCATETSLWQQVVFVFFWFWAVPYCAVRYSVMIILRVKIKQSCFCIHMYPEKLYLCKNILSISLIRLY